MGSSTPPSVLWFWGPGWRFRLRHRNRPSTADINTPTAIPTAAPILTPTFELGEWKGEGFGEEELRGTDVAIVVEELVSVLVGLDVAEGVEILLVVVFGSSVGIASVTRLKLQQERSVRGNC